MPTVTWICERELREGQGGRPLHLPDGVVESTDAQGKTWRTAVEVELTRKTEARVAGILRHPLAAYDDVVYRAVLDAGAVVTRAAASTAETGSTSGPSRRRDWRPSHKRGNGAESSIETDRPRAELIAVANLDRHCDRIGSRGAWGEGCFLASLSRGPGS